MTLPESTSSHNDTIHLERWAWYSLALNILLSVLHGILAISSGSLAVTAELTHNIVDLLASLAVIFGIRIANRKTKKFPYGLYKVENLLAAGISALILITVYEILHKAVFSPPRLVQVNAWMFFMLLVTTALPLIFSHFELRVAQSANSPALIADAKEYRVHIYTTSLALLALLLQDLPLQLDRIAAILIILAVLKTGWELLRDAMRVLLDASLGHETLNRLNEIIIADPAVSKIRWLTGRNAGRYRFVEAGVVLRVSRLEKAEKVLRRIESNIRNALPYIERVLLHIEAAKMTHLRFAVPLSNHDGSVSSHFGKAPYFAIVTLHRNNGSGSVEEQNIIINPYRIEKKTKGIRVAEWLIKEKIDAIYLKEEISNKGPEYVFRDAGVQIHTSNQTTLAAIISEECSNTAS